MYETTAAALAPLLPYLEPGTKFGEPCAGNGALIDLLEAAGHKCVWATDIAPGRSDIGELNAISLPKIGRRNIGADRWITNPPWTRSILHPIIEHLSSMLPLWAIFDSDWAYTNQARDLLWKCSRIVPVGRVKWIPGSKHVGFDNVAWYEFLPGHAAGPHFIPPGSAPPEAMMGPEERRRYEIRARGEVAKPGPLFEVVQGRTEGNGAPRLISGPSDEVEKINTPAAALAPPGPDAVSLLAKLRRGAGRAGPIPKLTPEAIDGNDA